MNFFEGGAFPEVHVPQYPRGMRGLTVPQWEAVRSKPSASGIERHQSVQGTLVVKHDAQIAPKPSGAEVQLKALETKAKLEEKLQRVTAPVGNLSERGDPLDPRPSTKSQSSSSSLVSAGRLGGSAATAIVVRHDPGPIVRSPTKKKTLTAEEAKLQEEMKSVPFCVSSWRNPKNIIVPLEERLAQAHGQETPKMAESHLELASVLRETKRRLQQQQHLDDKTTQEAMEQSVAKALEDAQQLLPSMQAQQQSAAAGSRETREERMESRRLEREHREREREARSKIRRYEAAAKRLGISVETLMGDAALRHSVDEGVGAHGGDDDLNSMVDNRVLLEAQRLQQQPSHSVPGESELGGVAPVAGLETTSTDTTSGAVRVTHRGIEDEMRRQAEVDAARRELPGGERRLTMDDHDDDDDDEDVFGLKDATRKRLRPEDM
mmetsp:Transcript_14234/g.16416  ORF Transcript_14234/g.16416 Transcript_14234/m.16416 type:complete len:436 (-) Transcript_14234:7-1314(-)